MTAKARIPRLPIGGGLVVVRDLRGLLPAREDGRYGPFPARPDDAIRSLVIHHTAGPARQTAEQIARYHVEGRGWAGIGYHFLARRSGVVEYVGDVTTSRANVEGRNPEVVGIACVGDFEASLGEGGVTTTPFLLGRLVRLCAALCLMWGRWLKVAGHSELGPTACPGQRLVARLPWIAEESYRLYRGG